MSGPLPAFLRPLTLPASRVYASVIAARNRRFDRRVGVQRIERPVISVGNITTGGTGKTPMVAWIARQLLQAGLHPMIAMRGYKARLGELSDEEAEYRTVLPDVPVVAHPNRHAALRDFLPTHPETDVVLLDDGFQHRQLHRDLDLVLIDATAATFHDALLPAGHLREPFQSLARAHEVIVTRAPAFDEVLESHIKRWHGRPPIAWTRHAWTQISIKHNNSRTSPEPVSWLKGKRIVTMLGVGNPQSVIAQTETAGARVMASIPAGDHERYDRAKLLTARGLCGGADGLFVTPKDWVKIQPLLARGRIGDWTVPIIVPQVEMEFIAGEQALCAMLLRAIPTGFRFGADAKPGGEGAAR